MEIFGVPVTVSLWSILLGLIVMFDAAIYIHQMMNYRKATWPAVSAALISAAIVVFSIFWHELAHGMMAKALGQEVLSAGLTGWGAYVELSTPFNEGNPVVNILISMAGPLANFILAGFFAILVWFYPESLAENSAQYLSFINLRLGYINLLPFFILDGYRILSNIARLVLGNIDSWGFEIWMAGGFIAVFMIYGYSRLGLERKLEAL